MNEFLGKLLAGGYGNDALSVGAVLFHLLLAFVLGQLIAWVYVRTHNGLSYSRSQVQSLVLLATIVTLVMLAVGNNLARAFGLFGALALVRFRTPVKDTRDTAFLFMSVGVGIAVGSQNVTIAVVGTFVLCAMAVYMFWSGFGSRTSHDGLLRFYLPAEGEADGSLRETMRRYCRSFSLVQMRDAGPGTEFAYQIKLAEPGCHEVMLAEMRDIRGLQGLSLLMQDEDQEV